MLDARSRVTVVGTRKKVDVAVPSAAPIGDYVAGLADLCGQARHGPLPRAWSLSAAGARPLPLDVSLAESGVADGQVLYLRELTRDPGGDPVVGDIDELVAGEEERSRRAGVPRGWLVLFFGLAWLAATAVLATGRYGGSRFGAAVSLTVAGLLLVATGWALEQRRVGLPAPLRLLVTLCAVPCLTVAGAFLGEELAGQPFRWAGAVAGANAATLMTLAATPEALTLVLQLQLAVAALLVPLLIWVRAGGVQTAAATVVVALAVLALARTTAATVTFWSHRDPPDGTPPAHEATRLLVRARLLLTAVVAGPALALAVALPVLALRGGGYGFALACVASGALLIRAGQVGVGNELVLIGGAGLVGLFGVLTAAGARFWPGATTEVALLTLVGLVLVAAGAVATHQRATAAARSAEEPGSEAGPPDRRRPIDVVGVLCTIATAPLALGVFGVLQELTGMGRTMMG